MNRLILRKVVPGTIFALLVASSIYYAIQLYNLSPDALVTSHIFIPENELKTNSEINVEDARVTIENSLLTLSATKRTNSDGVAILDTTISITIPLDPGLNITYSIYLSNLNLTIDAGRLYLHMFNGTHVIVMHYEIGNESPEYVYQNYTYLQYRIGNTTSTWLNGTRNIWNDLKNKEVPVTKSWKITAIVFGLVSYSRGGASGNSQMQVVFDLNETYLSSSNFTLASVDSASIKFSWLSLFGLIGSTSIFCVFSAVYLKISKRATPRRYET